MNTFIIIFLCKFFCSAHFVSQKRGSEKVKVVIHNMNCVVSFKGFNLCFLILFTSSMPSFEKENVLVIVPADVMLPTSLVITSLSSPSKVTRVCKVCSAYTDLFMYSEILPIGQLENFTSSILS